jgi:hypothetical protein
VTTPKLVILNLRRTNPDTDRNSAVLEWDISYTGGSEIDEDIEVALMNSEVYRPKGTSSVPYSAHSDTYTMDISDLVPGVYKAMVTGRVSDASSAFNITEFRVPRDALNPEILIR